MRYLDSWIWLEFFVDGDKADKAEEVFESSREDLSVISAMVLMEVGYRVKNFEAERAERLVDSVRSFERQETVPITESIALRAADLRRKYYSRTSNEFSYADAVHLSTALSTGCEVFYTGDSDFREVDEIEVEIV